MLLRDPAYLWALLGLLLPIAIHLLSRKAGKVVRVGSIRHLSETATRKFSSIRFNEVFLFAVRALLLTVFVGLLAGLSLSSEKTRPRWLLLEPGTAINDTGLQNTIDSLLQAGFEWRQFSQGFPAVGEALTDSSWSNYPYLLNELKATGAEAIVLAQNRIRAFRGKQQVLPASVRWMQAPADTREILLRADRTANDSVRLLTGSSSPERTEFRHQLQQIEPGRQEIGPDQVAITTAPAKKVLLVAPPEFARDAAIIKSAIAAIARISSREIGLEEVHALPDTTVAPDLLIAFTPLPKTPPDAGRTIRFRELPGSKLLVQTGRNTWELTARLDRELALEQEFPLTLSAILLEDQLLEQEIADLDQRAIEEHVFFTGAESEQDLSGTHFRTVDEWLIVLLLVLFVLERNLVFFSRA